MPKLKVLKDFDSWNVTKWLPKRTEIPQRFKFMGSDPYVKLVNDWFFGGLDKLEVEPENGVDKDDALKMINSAIRSWDPKHEHKTEAVAYMLYEFFKTIKYAPKNEKEITLTK